MRSFRLDNEGHVTFAGFEPKHKHKWPDHQILVFVLGASGVGKSALIKYYSKTKQDDNWSLDTSSDTSKKQNIDFFTIFVL